MSEFACKDASPAIFYEDIWPDTEVTLMPDTKALKRATFQYCDGCAGRPECFAMAMDAEKRQTVAMRAGVFGGLTPQQRRSLELRGIEPRCSCGALRDPYDLMKGKVRCPEGCGSQSRKVAKVPVRGDEWMQRHTNLARKAVVWLVENVEVDAQIPSATKLSGIMASRVSDTRRVFEALLADGTLAYSGNHLVRKGTGTADWKPLHLRSATVSESY